MVVVGAAVVVVDATTVVVETARVVVDRGRVVVAMLLVVEELDGDSGRVVVDVFRVVEVIGAAEVDVVMPSGAVVVLVDKAVAFVAAAAGASLRSLVAVPACVPTGTVDGAILLVAAGETGAIKSSADWSMRFPAALIVPGTALDDACSSMRPVSASETSAATT